MPKLLSQVAPSANPTFGPRDFAKRRALAALVAETISTWSYAEHALGRSLTGMSRGSSMAVMQQYAETTRFSGHNGKKTILSEAADANLPEPYRSTYLCAIDIIASYASKRYEFIHHIWGIDESLPEAILLVDPKYLSGQWGAANDRSSGFGADTRNGGSGLKFRSNVVEVWTKGDLETELDRISKAYDLSVALEAISSLNVFGNHNSRRDHAHNQLLTNPEVIVAQVIGNAFGGR